LSGDQVVGLSAVPDNLTTRSPDNQSREEQPLAQEFSFDIVSKTDMQEVANAINQAQKELAQRFDFKGSKSSIELAAEEIVLISDDEGKLRSVKDILETKLVKRGVALKAIDYQKLEAAQMGTVRQRAKIVQGIESEKAKAIVKSIKDAKLKVQVSIQSDQVRVVGRSKDDLQKAIALVKGNDFGIPLQFTNYRG
jgi:cyclic-di-GMP-binding protein